jgi:endoribonuclease Dicer
MCWVFFSAYYKNLLLKKILRWEDNCLVVFDEAHHCIKNHPFNQLLQEYHRKYPQNVRPKLLGLTASPAGRSTVQETVSMLHQLIYNLGGAMIALVEENTYELKKYQSNATMEINYTAMTRKEKSFKEELQIYLLNCYTRVCEETDLLQQFDLGLKAKKDLTAEQLLKCAKEVDGSLLNSLEITINMASPKEDSKFDRKIFSRNLIKHTQYICIALNVLIESGIQMAIEELQELMAIDPATSFEFADVNGLPCTRMKDALQTCMNVERSSVPLHSHEFDTSPQLSKLIEIVTRTDYVNWSNKGVMVLVLVKKRETAFKIKNMLNSHDAIEKLQLNVEAVVGHGSTSGTEQGMSVAQQKKILENMQKKQYHIVVATAVAEEGIDIPECELVITFNPPSTVTALVQMRGRARKNHSKFIILCNSSKEKVKFEDLMMKEKNMIEAAEQIIKEQKIKKI